MFVNVLLGAIIVFLILFIAVLISPFSFVVQVKRVSSLESALVTMYWLHPWILGGFLDLKRKVIDIRLFGRFVVYSRHLDKEQNGPGPERDEKAPQAPFRGKEVSARHETGDDADYGAARRDTKAGNLHSQGPGPGKPEATQAEEEKKEKEGPIAKLRLLREKFRNSSLRKALFFFYQESWRHKILGWLGRAISPLFRLFVLRRLNIHIRANLPEPSATGKLYGYWAGISHALMLGKRKQREIVFEPAFNEDCLEVEARLGIRTSLLRLLAPAVILIATFPYFSTFRVWRAGRKTTLKE